MAGGATLPTRRTAFARLAGAPAHRRGSVAAEVSAIKILSRVYLVVVAITFLAQLALGASPFPLITLVAVSLCGLIPMAREEFSVADLLYLEFCLYFGTLTLVIKSVIGQSVDTNLYTPDASAGILLACFGSITTGYLIARRLPLKAHTPQSLSSRFNDVRFLTLFTRVGYISGIALLLLHNALGGRLIAGSVETTQGINIFGQFDFLIDFALAGQLALCRYGKNPKQERRIAVAMLAGVVFFAIAMNIKKPMYDAATLLVLTTYVFRFRIRLWHVATAVPAFLALILVVTPLIHIIRGQGNQASFTERLALTWDILEKADFNLPYINRLYDREWRNQVNFRPDGAYLYPSTIGLERLMIIAPTDQVVRSQEPGRVPLGDLTGYVTKNFVPSFIQHKSADVLADAVSWYYGFRTHHVISRPVVGFPASAYAVGGIVAVLIIPGLVMGLFFYFVDMVSGRLRDSPWALGILFAMIPIAEKEIDEAVGLLTRDLVLITIFFIVTTWFYRFVVSTAPNSARSGIGGRRTRLGIAGPSIGTPAS